MDRTTTFRRAGAARHPGSLRGALFLALALAMTGSPAATPFRCHVEDPVYPDVLFPAVRIHTSRGTVMLELNRRRAPVTVDNFLSYVSTGAYAGTVVHRVVPGFVVQGGGYLPDATPIETRPPIMNESGNGLTNRARTVAMARHDDPHSATSQFYFNLADNESLDPSRRHWGYTVFGEVIEGWEVIEAIGEVETRFWPELDATDVPAETIVIEKVELVTD